MAEKITLHLGDEDQNVLGSVVFFLSLFLFFYFFFFIETSEFFVIVFLSPWSGIHTIMRMWYCQFLFPCTVLSLVNLIPADVRQVFVLFFCDRLSRLRALGTLHFVYMEVLQREERQKENKIDIETGRIRVNISVS